MNEPTISEYLDAAFDVLTEMANDYRQGTLAQRDAAHHLHDAASSLSKAADILNREAKP